MTKNDIDWKEFATELLWVKIVEDKNKDSGYDISESGEIGRWRYSAIKVPYRRLTWKELALELGVLLEHLTPDGHDCKVCSQRKDCKASFKDDPDQERCNGWKP
jgi:hypothetical protein